MVSAAVLAGLGWLGLLLLLSSTLPTVGPRWLFFFLLACALTGTVLPFIWLLHRRFAEARSAPSSTLLRQALFFTLYVEICTWLQINRSLSLSMAILLALGLISVEWFLNLLERSSWVPRR